MAAERRGVTVLKGSDGGVTFELSLKLLGKRGSRAFCLTCAVYCVNKYIHGLSLSTSLLAEAYPYPDSKDQTVSRQVYGTEIFHIKTIT